MFNEKYLSTILKDFLKNKKSANYYQAILQNLFFGTLNQKMDERDFAEDHNRTNKLDQGIKNKYRYADKFNISKKEIIDLFKDIPFLNGGLFDCLDKFDEEKLEKGKKEQIFVDGFTRLEDVYKRQVKSQAMPVAVNQIQNMFTGDITPKKISPEQKKLEDKFKPENFDLINWFVISNK